ncbi:MAG TPA: ABC transporter permease [Candidatus Saccharimonadales bacterium]|nr:ABC transporter permease [Candidatus Saccharimonadales bacterium]
MKHIFSNKNRALLSELVRTDFKLRYQNSVLGYAWSLLRPLLLFVILYVVFVKFLKLGNDIPHYPVYLLLGIVIWNFFVEMTVQSLGSIVVRGDLIRKIRIPRWIIILSSSISALINLSLNLIIVAVFMLINHVNLMMTGLLLPLILLEVYVFALGLSLFLSAAFVRFRDMSYIWDVLLQAGFYLTPILYPVSRIANPTLKKLLFINPMGQAIQDARYALVTHQTITIHHIFNGSWHQLIPFLFTLIALIVGVIYFKHESKYFAENI